MISFIVRMTFASEDHDQIVEILRALTVPSRQEPGCVSYVPHFAEGDATTVVIYEQYADEAALEHHRSSPHFQQYAVGGLYQRMLQRSLESLTAVA